MAVAFTGTKRKSGFMLTAAGAAIGAIGKLQAEIKLVIAVRMKGSLMRIVFLKPVWRRFSIAIVTEIRETASFFSGGRDRGGRRAYRYIIVCWCDAWYWCARR